MKAVMVMFDSLDRALLEPYGCEWTRTPNFQRLAQRSVTFDNCYAGSLPCMPARRELQTGRYNFLHRSWGPMEPFDDSVPQILDNHGIYTHLISDHTHYWEDGGATYHNRYSSWENVRGQEGDKWKGLVSTMTADPDSFHFQNKDGEYFQATGKLQKHDAVNRQFMQQEEDTCIARTVNLGVDFIERNQTADNWFLQIECFDPHEPFYVMKKYKEMFPDEYDGPDFDWPPYHCVTESEVKQKHLRMQYAALLAMCDEYLGRVLDEFDKLDLWKDTMLIVNTDHGYLLGEHGWWSKIVMPCYDEIVHTPLFIWDPRLENKGELREEIVQTIDIPATLLEFFNIELPKDMQGRPIRTVIEKNAPIRDYALFGIHGAHISVFDGRFVYMKSPKSQENKPLFEYTLIPNHMRNMFSVDELRKATLTSPDLFTFTKSVPVLKIPKGNGNGDKDFSELLVGDKNNEEAKHIDNNSLVNSANFGDKLFDMKEDPHQEHPINDVALETRMANLLTRAMRENDSPAEQFDRIGLPGDREVTESDILAIQKEESPRREHCFGEWTKGAENTYDALLKFIPKVRQTEAKKIIDSEIHKKIKETRDNQVTANMVLDTVSMVVPAEYVEMVQYFIGMSGRTS